MPIGLPSTWGARGGRPRTTWAPFPPPGSARASPPPQQLDGGQQQRVAIARAVIANPKLILADEPTGNLDSKNGKEVMELLTELNREGTTILMVTHSIKDSSYAQRVINLFDGNIVTDVKNEL